MAPSSSSSNGPVLNISSTIDFDADVDYEALPAHAPLSHQLLAGAFAGIMEHSTMFPIDALKTRIQSTTTKGTEQTSTSIIKQISKISTMEGSLALWKGVQSVILGAGPAHAVYFATYEFTKAHLIPDSQRETHQPIKVAVSGATATVASDFFMNPFDTIKQRMQISDLKKEKVYNVAKKIYNLEGLSAFYYSYPTTIAMNIPFAAFNFMIYESASKFFNPLHHYNPLIHCLCGGISGAIAAAVTTPLDCIKTVIQIRGSSVVSLEVMKKANTFKKATSAILMVYGWKGFWRGLQPRILANMPATAISWTAYECAKHFLFSTRLLKNDEH
ncbi:hypothetical protein NCAS_0A09800 [Naumovozyma castellii]|uniref:Uncharacterized protein n=1 Tax=Naumovozyma castellii TaxID=27288 RepID=G0V7U0_NAUCA|nr:hypothetical protein NCAS_0A09800 [Naumovozyma castellii CBS 4309]CCC67538.1 hypothetical protein NCAS_0A09800 [Naumovozyma castellii CBS 4309]